MVAGFISYAGVLEKLLRKSSSVVSTKLDRPVTVAEKRTLGKPVAILDSSCHPLTTVSDRLLLPLSTGAIKLFNCPLGGGG